VTVLATKSQPVIIIQNRGNTLLINGDEPATARYTVLPFLRQEGINQIQGAITVNNSAQFSTISESIPIQKTITLSQLEKFNLGEITGQLIEKNLFKFQVKNQSWLWIINPKNPVNLSQKFRPLVLLWQGSNLDKQWLESIRPQTAIAVTNNLSRNARNQLEKAGLRLTGPGEMVQFNGQQKMDFNPF
jgi:competence protein ComEC